MTDERPNKRRIGIARTSEMLGCALITVRRKYKTDPAFPQPIVFCGRLTWAESEIDDYVDALRRERAA